MENSQVAYGDSADVLPERGSVNDVVVVLATLFVTVVSLIPCGGPIVPVAESKRTRKCERKPVPRLTN